MGKKTVYLLLTVAAVCCAVMSVVDGIIQPGYAVKSAIKIALFLIVPLLLSLRCGDISFRALFRFERKGLLLALGLGIGLFALILGGYFLVRPFMDFSPIAGNLTTAVGVTKDSFLYVALYISFVNSLLEEFFFRGFLFLTLRKLTKRGFAYTASAVLFALYHTGMMVGAVGPVLVTLGLLGLVVGGMIFNWLNERQENIYTSWLVHMFANFAINTIGFLIL